MIARCARMCWAINAHRIAHAPHTAAAGSNFTGSQSRFHPAGAGFHSAHAGRISRSEPRRRARRYRVAGRWSCVSSGTPGNPQKIIRTPRMAGWYNALFQSVASLYATPPGFLSSHLFPGVALALLPLRLAPPPAIICRPRTWAHGFVSRKRLKDC